MISSWFLNEFCIAFKKLEQMIKPLIVRGPTNSSYMVRASSKFPSATWRRAACHLRWCSKFEPYNEIWFQSIQKKTHPLPIVRCICQEKAPLQRSVWLLKVVSQSMMRPVVKSAMVQCQSSTQFSSLEMVDKGKSQESGFWTKTWNSPISLWPKLNFPWTFPKKGVEGL